MFSPSPEQEAQCPHCPIAEPGEFAEYMYRTGQADLDDALKYTHKLRTFGVLASKLSHETRESLARLLNLPAHRVV